MVNLTPRLTAKPVLTIGEQKALQQAKPITSIEEPKEEEESEEQRKAREEYEKALAEYNLSKQEAAEWEEAYKWYKRGKPAYVAQGAPWYSKLMKLVKAQSLQEGKAKIKQAKYKEEVAKALMEGKEVYYREGGVDIYEKGEAPGSPFVSKPEIEKPEEPTYAEPKFEKPKLFTGEVPDKTITTGLTFTPKETKEMAVSKLQAGGKVTYTPRGIVVDYAKPYWEIQAKTPEEAIEEGQFMAKAVSVPYTYNLPFGLGTPRGAVEQSRTQIALAQDLFKLYKAGKQEEYEKAFTEEGKLKEEVYKKYLKEQKNVFKAIPIEEQYRLKGAETDLAGLKIVKGFVEFPLTWTSYLGVQKSDSSGAIKAEGFKFGGRVGYLNKISTVSPLYKPSEEPFKWGKEVITDRPSIVVPAAVYSVLITYFISKMAVAYSSKGVAGITQSLSRLSPIAPAKFTYFPKVTEGTRFNVRSIDYGSGRKLTVGAGKGTDVSFIQRQIKMGDNLYGGKVQVYRPVSEYTGFGFREGEITSQFKTITPIKVGKGEVYTEATWKSLFGKDYSYSLKNIKAIDLQGGLGKGIIKKEWDVAYFPTRKGLTGYGTFYKNTFSTSKVLGVSKPLTDDLSQILGGKRIGTKYYISREGVRPTELGKIRYSGYELRLGDELPGTSTGVSKQIRGKIIKASDIKKLDYSSLFKAESKYFYPEVYGKGTSSLYSSSKGYGTYGGNQKLSFLTGENINLNQITSSKITPPKQDLQLSSSLSGVEGALTSPVEIETGSALKVIGFLPSKTQQLEVEKQLTFIEPKETIKLKQDDLVINLGKQSQEKLLEQKKRSALISKLFTESLLTQDARTKQVQVIVPKLSQKQIQQQKQKQITGLITQPFTTPGNILEPFAPITPPGIPLIFPKFKRKDSRKRQLKKLERERKERLKRYQASVGAVSLGIYTKKKPKQKKFTGLELRPIIKRSKKKTPKQYKNYVKKINKLLGG